LQTKPPAAVVVMVAPAVPEVQLATVMATPLYASVTPEVPANPVAVTVTLLPTRPLVGANGEIVQAVTVYGEKKSLCPEKASVATAVAAPAGAPLGTVNVQTNPPPLAGVMAAPDNVPELQADGVTATPPNASVTVEPDTVENAEPVAVTVLPTRPLAGERTSKAGVKDVLPVMLPTVVTVAVADTVYE